jgi:hypothetical protein
MLKKIEAPGQRVHIASGEFGEDGKEQKFSVSMLIDHTGFVLELAEGFFLLETEEIVKAMLGEFYHENCEGCSGCHQHEEPHAALSLCCNADVTVAGDENSTRYYVCTKCGKACDCK